MIRAMKLEGVRSFFYLVVPKTSTTNWCLKIDLKTDRIDTYSMFCDESAFRGYREATVAEILEDFSVEELMEAARSVET